LLHYTILASGALHRDFFLLEGCLRRGILGVGATGFGRLETKRVVGILFLRGQYGGGGSLYDSCVPITSAATSGS